MENFHAEVLVEESGPLVRWVIRRSFPTFIRRWFDEMYSVGLEAVWHAALAYRPSGNPWPSWASTRVYWAILTDLRNITGARLVPDSPKRTVHLEHDLPDPKHPDPGRDLEIADMLDRLQRRLGRDYIFLEGVLEDRSLADSARRMGLSEGGACTRRKKLFERIRAGDHGNLIEV